jgi:hypothetical protein
MLHVCEKVRTDQPLTLLEFLDMYDEVHIDEKWFYIQQDKEGFLTVVPDEGCPDDDKHYRSVKSKNFIQKVMFLAAVARPWGDFDGKIGIWAFVSEYVAERNSVNRPAGTVELKNVTVNKEVYKAMVLDDLVPAIREKWPADRPNPRVQQDNATPHKILDDPAVIAALSSGDENNRIPIVMYFQPPNSPDFNILDLGFFRALQSLQQKKRAKTIEELIGNVETAWDEYPPEKLNRVWLTLQSCFDKVLTVHGQNDYKIPHMNKKRLENAGELPVTLQLSEEAREVYGDFMGAHG